MSYIVKYLIEILFTITTAFFAYMIKKTKKIIKTIDSNRNSLLVLSKNLFVQRYYYYKRMNYICFWEKDALKKLYEEYKELGENGIVDGLFKEIDKIPIIREDEEYEFINKRNI